MENITRKDLQRANIKPIKHRGQNFLISPTVIKNIIRSAQVKNGETILEVGPGTGNLTRALLEAGAEVIAVEKDHDLVELLELKIQISNLKIIEGDILKFDETTIKTPYRVIANIPYYLTGQLIQKFLLSDNKPVEMILMVQKEVGERLTAQPPQANYLSSLVNFLARAEILFKVGKENFWPKPEVDSVMIKIVPRSTNPSVKPNDFIVFLRQAFKQPRQTLLNNLARGGFDKNKTENIFKDLGLTKNTRAQTLSVGELARLLEKIT